MAGKVIVVTSGKGGVGKTTMTANLGMALAAMGLKVCLVDTDMGLRNLDLVLGLEQRIIFDIVDVAHGTCRLQQALIHDRRQANLYFLPASQRCDKSVLRPLDMRLIAGALRESFDYVLVDCPAGIEDGFAVAIAGADEALVVVTPEVSSVRDADRVVGLLEKAAIRDVRLIINRCRPELIAKHDQISVADIEELIGAPALAIFPDDPAVITSTNKGEPLALDKQAKLRKTFEGMATAIAGQEIHALVPSNVTFFGKLRAIFAS